MRALTILPIFLLNLPYKIRLNIITIVFSICLGLHWLIFPSTHNGTMVVIPVLLAAWMFGFRGAILSAVLSLLGVASLNSLLAGALFWPRPLFFSTVVGFVGSLFVGFVISSVRYTIEKLEAARSKELEAERQKATIYQQKLEALEAERKMTIAYEQQRHLNELKDQFILNVNHELRTPLTQLHGYLELLTLHQEIDSAKKDQFLKQAIKGSEELLLLVNAILDVTNVKSEVGSPQPGIFCIAPIIYEAVECLDPREKQVYHFNLEIPEQLTAWADQQYVRQILRNLLSNACKYCPQDSSITIQATYEDSVIWETDAAPQIRICVKDTGPGIPPDELPYIFEKFVRLKRDISKTIRGTGLGLYICKQLTEAIGGRIWVESSGIAGEGSRFYFTLPSISDPSVRPSIAVGEKS